MAREPGSRGKLYRDEPTNNPKGPQHVDPHSKWQILIEDTRAQKKIPMRELANKAQIHPSTLFNWLRSKRGYPSRLYYTQQLNRRLAAALGLKADALVAAYDESSSVPPLGEENPGENNRAPRPAPLSSNKSLSHREDGLARFLSLLKASGSKTFTLEQIEELSKFITG